MSQDRYEDSMRFNEIPKFNGIKHLSCNRYFVKVCEVSNRNLTTCNFFLRNSFKKSFRIFSSVEKGGDTEITGPGIGKKT